MITESNRTLTSCVLSAWSKSTTGTMLGLLRVRAVNFRVAREPLIALLERSNFSSISSDDAGRPSRQRQLTSYRENVEETLVITVWLFDHSGGCTGDRINRHVGPRRPVTGKRD